MHIRINGEDRKLSQNMNVWDLLISLEIDPLQSGIAVAVERVVMPKSKWKRYELTENSEVEIIRAVQGVDLRITTRLYLEKVYMWCYNMVNYGQ